MSDRNGTCNVLFLRAGNSCRSILDEATFNHLAPPGWRAMSAGSKPTGRVHPRSLAWLQREGISTVGYYRKSWDDLPQTPDIVITVCSSAAGETCPAYLGPLVRTHWGVDDPAHATGTAEESFVTTIQVFDPSVCCSTGVCGAEVDAELVRFAADAAWAREQGIQLERLNLARQPLEFANNPLVKAVLQSSGEKGLPLTLVDGVIRCGARYPTRAELAEWAGKPSLKSIPVKVSSTTGCCGPGTNSRSDSGCC